MDSGVEVDRTYVYRVIVENTAGLEASSDDFEVSFALNPSVITSAVFESASASVRLAWTRSFSGFEHYEIREQIGGDPALLIITHLTDIDQTTFVNEGLDGNTEYIYHVVVRSSTGKELASESVSGKIHEFLSSWSVPDQMTGGIRTDENNRVYITSTDPNRIYVYAADGTLLEQVEPDPDDPTRIPVSIAVKNEVIYTVTWRSVTGTVEDQLADRFSVLNALSADGERLFDWPDENAGPRPGVLRNLAVAEDLIWVSEALEDARNLLHAIDLSTGNASDSVEVDVALRALFIAEDENIGLTDSGLLTVDLTTGAGETGSGGGARLFHTDLWGNGKQFQGFFIYAGGRGQMAGGVYLDPSLLGSSFVWKFEGEYLRTRNRSATVNAAVREDEDRLFKIDRGDVRSTLGWRLNAGNLAPYKRNFIIDVWAGYGRRDLRQREGPPGPLTHPGSTARANALNGLGRQIDLYRFGGRVAYDDRDYKRPVQEIMLPLNYVLPGRVLTYSNGFYHSYRDLGYPERGGMIAAEAEWVSGSDEVRFTRIAAELSRYVTLFWRDRILAVRARLEKVSSVDQHTIPYTDLVLMGGSTSARGYRRGYFRGQGALLFSLEYRYPIWDTWNAFIFWDETQIFDDFDKIERNGFRTSWGGGISLRTEIGLLGKIRVGHSAKEKALIGFVLEQAF